MTQLLQLTPPQGWVGYAVGRLLPAHSTWTFAHQADRWRLCGALLRVLLWSLRCDAIASPAASGASLRLTLAAALIEPGAAIACLAAAMPPDAGARMACPWFIVCPGVADLLSHGQWRGLAPCFTNAPSGQAEVHKVVQRCKADRRETSRE